MENPLISIPRVITKINQAISYFVGDKQRPVFFDIAKDYPELLVIQDNYRVIREELEGVLKTDTKIPCFHEIDTTQTFISANQPNKNWRMFELYCYGQKPEANRQLCPKTCAILDKIPSIQHAVFSILEPGKSIPFHMGPYMGILRYHLGLIVPQANPPYLHVKDKYYTWKEGESVLFDDTWIHQVINESQSIRVVLFIDVKRKLPFPVNLMNSFLLKTLATRYGKSVMEKLDWQH